MSSAATDIDKVLPVRLSGSQNVKGLHRQVESVMESDARDDEG